MKAQGKNCFVDLLATVRIRKCLCFLNYASLIQGCGIGVVGFWVESESDS